MRSTIDKAGRIIVPKAMRDELGLTGGAEVEIGLIDGRIEIAPVASHIRLERKRGRLVAASDREMPVLTSDDVRALLEKLRR
jgi:AbrB family looped-hinge helix DNA binding protein